MPARRPPRRSHPLERAYRELEQWLRSRLPDSDGDLPDEAELTIRIPFRLKGRGRRAAQDRFVRHFEREVDALRDRIELDTLGYRPGHVYCHWCRSPVCEHSLPPDERSVFVGYEATGQPRWREFSSWAIELRDPRIERLYLDRPVPLALYSPGRELVRDLLADFGRQGGPYHVVAQVSAGLFRLPARHGRSPSLFAFTAQLVERRTPEGQPHYHVNAIAHPPAPHHFPTLVADRVSPVLTGLVESLRQAESQIADRIREAQKQGRRLRVSDCRNQGRAVFEALPGRLEKLLRQGQRRSAHADVRARDPERPTASALPDARQADAQSLFLDRENNTVIVKGPRRRVHVYRRDGTHITSIVYPGETLRDRVKSGRWSPLEPELATAWREGLEARGEVPFSDDED